MLRIFEACVRVDLKVPVTIFALNDALRNHSILDFCTRSSVIRPRARSVHAQRAYQRSHMNRPPVKDSTKTIPQSNSSFNHCST